MQTIPYKSLLIKEIISETATAKSFVLEPLGWRPVYSGGQFVTLVFTTLSGEKRRSYSISSCPELGEPLKITIKKVDNGEFSRKLIYEARPGDVLTCSGIAGHFVLPAGLWAYETFYFLAAGSGIGPCFSLLRSILYLTNKKVRLIYSNRSESETIFYEDLKWLEKRFSGRFEITFLFSEIKNVYKSRLSNWLLPQLLGEQDRRSVSGSYFFLCGPFDYMQMAEITLLSKFPLESIRKEHFIQYPRLIFPEPPDREAHLVTLAFNGEEHRFSTRYPVSVLAAAKNNNLRLPYSCEAGRCGSCIATCTSGKTWMAYNEILTDKEVEEGRVLICQAYPVGGDVRIEF